MTTDKTDITGYIGVSRQGSRIYSVDGINPTITASGGGLAGNGASLIMTSDILNPLKGKTDFGWHFEQAVYHPDGIARTLKATSGSGNIPKIIEDGTPVVTDYTPLKYETESYPFKYISLFAGIGGFDYGLNNVGGECVFASEIDKYAQESYKLLHDGSVLHGDITKIEASSVPDHDVLAGGFPCFTGGTLVRTENGLVPIETIETGTRVLTHTGVFRPVVTPMAKEVNRYLKIKVLGAPSLNVTHEHPLYVIDKDTDTPYWLNAEDLDEDKHLVATHHTEWSIDNVLNITQTDAYTLGVLVSNGALIESGDKQQLKFTSKAPQTKMNNRDFYRYRLNNEWTHITHNQYLVELYKLSIQNGGLSDYILQLAPELLHEFLSGFFTARDTGNNGIHYITTPHKTLAITLATAVRRVYNRQVRLTEINGNQPSSYTLTFNSRKKDLFGTRNVGGLWFAPVVSKQPVKQPTLVYNLEVDTDNTYTAEGLVVHNCQAFSMSGKRRGFEDARGTLFFDVARIAREKQPKAIFLENVKGIVGHDNGKTLETIIRTLSEIGYRSDMAIINSKYYGVPQNRERIFIIGIREDLVENEPWHIEGTSVLAKGMRRIQSLDGIKTFNFDFPQSATTSVTLRDILETRVAERFYLNEAHNERLVLQLRLADNVSHSGTESEPVKLPDNHKKTYVKDGDDLKYVQKNVRVRRLTPKECWRLQGFTDEQHDLLEAHGLSNSQRYKQAGNAVTVNVITAIGEKLLKYLK